MNNLIYCIGLPLITGIILFAIPKASTFKAIVTVLTSIAVTGLSILLYSSPNSKIFYNILSEFIFKSTVYAEWTGKLDKYFVFRLDEISKLVIVIIGFYAFIISLYSIKYLHKKNSIQNYYSYFLLTLGFSIAAVLSNHLLFFIFCWGFLGITLYKLIHGNDEESAAAAKKSLILIGASDSIMILGIALIWKLIDNMHISEISLQTNNPLSTIAFLALLIGAFTKAGAFPFHTWVPDFAKKAPASSSAYLPASLDKLLGIYFIFRLCAQMFVLNEWLILTLVIIGVATIIIGVMMALIQHNYKKLLGYHAVSQVGYMVLGLGIGSPLAIAGGLFHMINNTLYKGGLFLIAGNVENQTNSDDIEPLGGLSKTMPLTFIAAIIFALSISGVPPLNGFASKWLIYQGIIDFGKVTGLANQFWMIWLGLAIIGSALTLASFIKFLSGIFMGKRSEIVSSTKEVNILMWLPIVLLAILCILVGVFASSIVIPEYIMPMSNSFVIPGIWSPGLTSILIIAGVVMGILLYLIGNLKKIRRDDIFLGGEKNRDYADMNVLESYSTISDANFFSTIYHMAEKKWFDIYDLSKEAVFGINKILSRCHTGVLPLYTVWLIAGLIVLLILLI